MRFEENNSIGLFNMQREETEENQEPENSKVYYADLLESDASNKLLERYYHSIARAIRPHLFYTWLRAKQVFSLTDQEEIENKFITTALKAGHMIDIIRTKGKLGFIAFMEVIEYEYPELFSMMTSLEPRTPPKNFYPSSRSTIRHRVNADVICKLTQELFQNKERSQQQQQQLDQMKADQQQVFEQNEILSKELRDIREDLERLQAENDKLSVELSKVTEEKEKCMEECSKLRTEKDSYMDEWHKLRRSWITHDENSQSENLCNHETQLKSLLNTSNAPTLQCEDSNGKEAEQQISLHSENDHSERKNEQWMSEKSSLTKQLTDFHNKLQLSQQTSELYLMSFEHVKRERDEVLEKLESLQDRYNQEASKTRQLTTECEHYIEKFRRMEETMQNLYHEIDQLKLLRWKRFAFDPRAIRMRQHERHDDSNLVDEICEITAQMFDGAAVNTTCRRFPRSNSDDTALCAKEVQGMTSPMSQPELHPLLMPRSTLIVVHTQRPHIQQPLMQILRQSFDTCDYVQMTPSQCSRNHVIHQISSSCEKTCSVLTVQELRKCLNKERPGPVVLTLPVSSIKTIHSFDIKFVILTIIFQTDSSRPSSVSEEEDALLELCRPGHTRYEQLEICSSLADDIPRLADNIKIHINTVLARTV